MIEYIPYNKRYKKQCIDLYKIGLSINFSENRFKWLHFQNPLAPSNIILAINQKKVIGIYSIIKKKMRIGCIDVIGGRDIDPVVHPNYRRKGVFTNLLRNSFKIFYDVDLQYNFANEKSSPGFMKQGWRQININNYSYWISPFDLSKRYLLSKYSKWYSKNKITKHNYCVCEIDFTQFVFNNNKIKNEFPIYVIKNYEYFKWRYFNNPDRKYRYFQIQTENNEFALVICRIENKSCFLLDICNQSSLSNKDIMLNLFNYFNIVKYKLTIYTWGNISKRTNTIMLNPKKNFTKVFIKDNEKYKYKFDIFDSNNWYIVPGESEFM